METVKPSHKNEPKYSSQRANCPRPMEDLAQYVKDYAKQRPERAALWCFGIGFVLGWKLKPW